MKRYLPFFLTAFAGAAFALVLNRTFEQPTANQSVPAVVPVQQAAYTASGMPLAAPDFVDAASQSVHAVVHIMAEWEQKNSYYDDFFSFFNGWQMAPQRRAPISGTGSGVIISADGYIVTNNHVVQDASHLEVTLNDKRTFEAKIVGTDPTTDLALIKIDAEALPTLSFGNSDEVKVGEWVLAVGNPFNLTSTVTAGIVSAKARNINILSSRDGSSIESFIQTDAAVNPGNSGGALVNTKGELVGINAAIASRTGSYSGYSFAIPANIARKVARDLMQFGEVQRAYIGIQIREVDGALAEEKGWDQPRGVYVAGILEGSSAAKGGLKVGDVIVSVQGHPVNSNSELLESVAQYSPGDEIALQVMRNNNPVDLKVVLTNETGTTEIVKRQETDFLNDLGAALRPVDGETARKLGLKGGAEVYELRNGPLAGIGIRKGFVITRIDRRAVQSADDVRKALQSRRGGVLIEGVYPNGVRAYYGLGL